MRKIIFVLSALIISATVNAQYGNLFFEENFDDNNRSWFTSKEKDEKIEVKSGHYIIKRTDSETSNYYYLPIGDLEPETENFTIEVKLKQNSGEGDQGYGLRWSIYSDLSNYRNFFISSNNYYKVSHYYNQQEYKKKDWTNVSNVINGMGKYNVLRIERNANILRYFINDKEVCFDGDNIYHAARLGFFVSGKNEVWVDYVKIWKSSPIVIDLVDNPIENTERENLGANINSEGNDKSPVVSPDGKTLYFSRSDYKNNLGGVNDEDIYYSTIDENGKWTKAVNIGKPVNNVSNNGLFTVLPDNNTLMLTNRYKLDGSSDGAGLSTTKRTATGWETPTNINVKNYYNNSIYVGNTISPSGKILILAVERNDTKGQRDLYVSFLNRDGSWTEPKNMGNVLNTPGNEDTPFMAADDKTLYFSSDGFPGYGSADVYVSKRLDDTWLNWSKPKNLGKGINSINADYGFKIDGKGEYSYLYKWDNDGFGKSDIFRIKIGESVRPDPVVLVKGKVLDSETKEPVTATISYENLDTQKEVGIANIDPRDGSYQIMLPYGVNYGFLAKHEGYYPVSENLDIREVKEYREIIKDLYLTKVKKGVSIRLNNIFFEYDKADLKSESFNELNRLVDFLNENKTIKIEIAGHTDSQGNDDYNQKLSEKRAASVRTYLLEKSISADRITSKGYGEAVPLDTNDTEEGRAINRRVEFKILE